MDVFMPKSICNLWSVRAEYVRTGIFFMLCTIKIIKIIKMS